MLINFTLVHPYFKQALVHGLMQKIDEVQKENDAMQAKLDVYALKLDEHIAKGTANVVHY